MKQKIQITETVLKQMIVKAINESLSEFHRDDFQPTDITKEGWAAIQKWALNVRNGMNYKDDRIFGPFYMALANNAKLKYIVLKAFGYENTEISSKKEQDETGKIIRVNNPEKPSLDTYRMCNDGMADDVISEFFSGISNAAREETESDAFPGHDDNYNLKVFVNIALNGEPTTFIHKLSNLLGFYARHYFRKHYDENVIHYSNRSKPIEGDKSKDTGYDAGDYNADQKNDITPTDSLGSTSMQTGNGTYVDKMIKLANIAINDERVGLSPQQKEVMQALVDVASKPKSPETIEQMQGLSEKQQVMMIYKEIEEITGVSAKDVSNVLYMAAQKIKNNNRMQRLKNMDEKKQKLVNMIVNEVLNRLSKGNIN